MINLSKGLINHENDYYERLRFINKSKLTSTDANKENNNGLVHKRSSTHKCALCINFKPIESFHSSLTHKKYVTKCDDKSINTLNYSASNSIYFITCRRFSLQYVEETVPSLRDSFSGHSTDITAPFTDNKCKILS